MKKLYTLALAIGIAGLAHAQKSVSTATALEFPRTISTADGYRTPTDTLVPGEWVNATGVTIYTSASGYVVGNNDYGDKAKAELFILSEPTLVEEVLFWFGAKIETSGNSASKIVAKLWDNTGNGHFNISDTDLLPGAPGSVLGSVDVFLSDADTSSNLLFTVAQFATPVYVGTDFYAGFDVTTLAAGDSIGLVSTTSGDGAAAELAWELWSGNGGWYSFLVDSGGWGLDFDLAIFPVVDNGSAGIDSESFFNGIKMSQNQPNPVGAETVIQYELQNNAAVTFEMYDVTGKKVISVNEGEQNKGKHTLNITTEKLASGTYYYMLNANGNRLAKKMVIAK